MISEEQFLYDFVHHIEDMQTDQLRFERELPKRLRTPDHPPYRALSWIWYWRREGLYDRKRRHDLTKSRDHCRFYSKPSAKCPKRLPTVPFTEDDFLRMKKQKNECDH